jgi:hypothetical protein
MSFDHTCQKRNRTRRVLSVLWLPLLMVLAISSRTQAQVFTSGSTGADGALDYSNLTAGTVVVFDPTKLSNQRPAGTNVFNFTTINIPVGITVKLRGDIVSAPVYWLASGDVVIYGTVDLVGQDGPQSVAILDGRRRAIPGSGGFAGGVGGKYDTYPPPAGEPSAQPGDGPGGGQFYPSRTDCRSRAGYGGTNTANAFLVPLVGGSGGAGSNIPAGVLAQQVYGAGGGAGGGALLIASSTSITINGRIAADGGRVGPGGTGCQYYGGGGAGGSIRLAAPVVSGNGILTARAGKGADPGEDGNDGFLRIEAFTDNFSGSTNATPFSQGSPFATFVPQTAAPSVTVISVNGINVTQPPTGNLATPDVAINTSAPVTLSIQAANIPLGTVLTLHVLSDNDTDQAVQTSPLAGTLQSSIATATVTFPSGFSLN